MTDHIFIFASRWAEIAIAIAAMGYGSYTDVRKRKVNSFLFVPLLVSGLAANLLSGFPEAYIIYGVAAFMLAYVRPTVPAYLVTAVALLAFAFYFTIYVDFYFGFTMVIIAVVYALGYGERLFGIGDIKAIISAAYAFPYPVIFHGYSVFLRISAIPGGLVLITAITMASIIWAAYGIGLSLRSGSKNGIPFAMAYDEELARRKPAAFQVRERNGEKYMTYRIPFMLPVFAGLVIYIILGSLV